MSIAIATRGIISGFMGAGGESVYVEVPVCNSGPSAEEVGELSFTASDPNAVSASPSPVTGNLALPRRKSTVPVLPSKNDYPDP